MKRDDYIKYRRNNDQSAILTTYFAEKTNQPTITPENFISLMWQAIEDDPFLQQKIDHAYPKILSYYDKKFEVNFLFKQYNENHTELIKIY